MGKMLATYRETESLSFLFTWDKIAIHARIDEECSVLRIYWENLWLGSHDYG